LAHLSRRRRDRRAGDPRFPKTSGGCGWSTSGSMLAVGTHPELRPRRNPLVFGSARRTQRWANLDRSQPPATSRMSGVRAMRCGDDGRWRNRPTCGAPRKSKNPGVSARTVS